MTSLALTGKLKRMWNQKLLSVAGPFFSKVLDVPGSSHQSTPEPLKGKSQTSKLDDHGANR